MRFISDHIAGNNIFTFIKSKPQFAARQFENPRELGKWHYVEVSQPVRDYSSKKVNFDNKVHNLNLVIQKIQYLEILPGEVFSFWQVAGNPNKENGFKPGAIFIDDRIEQTVGGGLCQISTAIYGCALHAGCKILRRYPHTIDAFGEQRYYPLGQDGTVAYPRVDLQFTNPFNEPMVLHCRIEDRHMKVRLYTPRRLCTVTVVTELLKTIPRVTTNIHDKKRADGVIREGSDGKVTKTERVIRSAQGPVIREHVSTDTYRPIPKIINSVSNN